MPASSHNDGCQDRRVYSQLSPKGRVVLKLSIPQVAWSAEERCALRRSVNQYAIRAARSDDPRVWEIRVELDATIKPRLRLVASR